MFYTSLFEMWSAGRRSRKIGNVFRQSQDEVVKTVMRKLQSNLGSFIDKLNCMQIEALSRLILALTDGTAFQLVIQLEKVLHGGEI